jgi:hypothetical protein
MDIKLFGIRHHGPGSSRSLIKGLNAFLPDVILVEGAPELDDLMSYVADKDLIPPVAALIYNPKDLKQAVYYPFTAFSPEWQSFLFAHKNKIPVVNMDLPQSLGFGLDKVPEKLRLLVEKEDEGDNESQAIAKDPLGFMASLAGYQDSERWWEVMFEQGTANVDIFDVITDMMSALREEVGSQGQAMNLLREAYMRKILRKAVKNGYKRIAVVCGAWHCPALSDLKKYSIKNDNELIKDIPRVRTKSTWIAWTYERIASSSGYGAGVVSPAWYELLYENKEEATITWMAKVSQLFKNEDIDTSSAHAIEAVRLAETLATLRGLQLPGIDELSEAVVTIFSGGYEAQLELIREKLIVGDKMGEVPASIPVIPLQEDIDYKIKKLKFYKYKTPEAKWFKASANRPRGGLDLRKEHDLKQSQFLHRLTLLDIEFGTEDKASGRELSTKNEYWKMQWKPDFSIQIIEAGMWGNTTEQAAVNWVTDKASKAESLTDLTNLLQKVIHADLPAALSKLVLELRNLAALTQDINHLMNALPALVHINRYGDVRNTEIGMVNELMHEMIPRICISLSASCASLDESAERMMYDQILISNKALTLLNDQDHLDFWMQTLLLIAGNERTGGLIRGACTRISLDNESLNVDDVAIMMQFALSSAVKTAVASEWVEGFLHGSGLLLIHNPVLWKIVDDWVSELKNDDFQELLPILRKTFSSFAEAERKKMLQIVKDGHMKTEAVFFAETDPLRTEMILPVLKLLLKD